jgi:hypothetical protein
LAPDQGPLLLVVSVDGVLVLLSMPLLMLLWVLMAWSLLIVRRTWM